MYFNIFVQVLYPALKWLEHDTANRRRHCFEVLSHIRLPLISPQVLDDAIKTVQDPSIAVALKTVRVDMVRNDNYSKNYIYKIYIYI